MNAKVFYSVRGWWAYKILSGSETALFTGSGYPDANAAETAANNHLNAVAFIGEHSRYWQNDGVTIRKGGA